jgi:hypothetical protein
MKNISKIDVRAGDLCGWCFVGPETPIELRHSGPSITIVSIFGKKENLKVCSSWCMSGFLKFRFSDRWED